MKYGSAYYFLLLIGITFGCVKKPEEMEGPTIGKLNILADESIKDIVMQEEEIFEREYPYAHLDIRYTNEYDMFSALLKDSIDVIVSTRALNPEEMKYLQQRNSLPKTYPFATSAIAFIRNRNSQDTTLAYEQLFSLFRNEASGTNFVIENVKSGITGEILRLLNADKLPAHFYALPSKKEVLEYIQAHDNAIGIIDYSDISDTDNAYTAQVLASIHLIGLTRPADSTQVGFVKPFQYNLQDWKYPFTRELYVISNTGKSDLGVGFASFICGEIGQKIILKAGLLPKFQTERQIEINQTSDIKVVE